MKYIAIFDIPNDYEMGCAVAKIKPKGKVVCDTDCENAYAQVEPLSNGRAEMLEKFNAVSRIIYNLDISNAYDMPGFWCNNRKDYKEIPTNYHRGYMQALGDVEKEIRLCFGFAEKDDNSGDENDKQ